MSRSRPYKKNDNAWVEQRNWTHVRKVVGYSRLDSTAELAVLNELYEKLRLYKNFFQPSLKLKEKIRESGKIRRKYDEPRTPHQRVLESKQIPAAAKQKLKTQYASLSVAQLHREIEALRNRLFDLGKAKGASPKPKRRGREIRVRSTATKIWMRRMMRKDS
jgi:hypothetical protein